MPILHRQGTEAQMRAMGSVGTLFAIVSRSANAVSQVNWRLWRKAASGLDEDRTEVTTHAALDLLDQPNPHMSRQRLFEGTQQHVDLTGEGWWVIARSGRSPLPLEIWYVRPDRIAPVPSATDFIDGYIYTGPDGEKIPLGLDEVIPIQMPNPLDPYRGMGPVQSILVDLDSARYSAEWNRNFFLNGAEPGGIIEAENRLSDDEFDEASARFRENHQGVANAHRVAVLEMGLKWVERSFNQRDMQFVELRNVSREVILEAFGMSRTMIGAAESETNRATAETAEVVFSRWFLRPRLERYKEALNGRLLPLYGAQAARGLEFDYDDPTPQSSEEENAELTARSGAASALVTAGWAPPDVLEAVGLPEMTYGLPGSDPERDLLIDLVKGAPSLAPLILPMLGFDVPEGAAPAALPPGEPAIPVTARLALPHHHRHGVRNQDDEDIKQAQLETVQEDWQAILDRLMGDWADITLAQRREIYRQVEAAVDAGDPAALAAITVDTADAAALLAAAMVELAAIAAGRVVEEAAEQGEEIDPVEPDSGGLIDFAAAAAALLGANIAAAAGREAIRRTFPGVTGEQVADEVDAHLEETALGRQTEDQLAGALSNAQNTARIETLRAAPVAAYYGEERLDSNTCVNCRDVDGKWLGNDIADVEAVYPNGGYKDCLGRERCRGTVTAIWRPEEVSQRPAAHVHPGRR